ncbi:MAG TPA: hypothetical protein VFJ64_10710 [Solirubrobacterales bacterium]|nr:hypothetical protein [Solirubrobacterales bacterium]
MDDLEVETRFLVELGNALNVAGDHSIGAARRLRTAPTAAARGRIRRELAIPIRRILWAAGLALAVLEEGSLE